MGKSVSRVVILHAIRWSCNMLVEAVNQCSETIPAEARESLLKALVLLNEAADLIRRS